MRAQNTYVRADFNPMRHIPLLALAAALSLSCQPSAPDPGETSGSRTPATATAYLEQAAQPVQTALMIVRMTPKGELSVGDLQPRPIAWVDATIPYSAKLHDTPRTTPEATPEVVKPAPAPFWDLAVVVEHPDRAAPLVTALEVMAPKTTQGDVLDPWQMGGALWRVPWLGEGTRYRVVRTAPTPTLELARWEGGR